MTFTEQFRTKPKTLEEKLDQNSISSFSSPLFFVFKLFSIKDELSGFARISYDEDIHGVVTVQMEGVDFVSEDYVYEIDLLTGKEYNEKYKGYK